MVNVSNYVLQPFGDIAFFLAFRNNYVIWDVKYTR